MAEQTEPLGNPPSGEKPDEQKKESKPTRYRILWGRMPDPEDSEATIVYREVLNPDKGDGAYVATSAETARRAAFRDERTEQHPHIQQALRGHGVRMRHVALQSWGDDDPEGVLKIETREDLTGRL
jgi:hypothetical protein